jgi:hypothetical protein
MVALVSPVSAVSPVSSAPVVLPSFGEVLSALPAGCLVSPSVVPFAAVVCGAGFPVPVASFVASAPAALLGFGARVCSFPCSCGRPVALCRCPSLAVVLVSSGASGGSCPCVLVWLAAPVPPPPAGCGPALAAVRAAVASRASSSPVRVAVVGSRGFPALSLVAAFVAALPAGVAVVSGAARGVDAVAEDAARARGLAVVSLPASWSSLGRRAGMMRNAEVIARADVLVAFWDGASAGTADAIRRARKEGIAVFVVSPPASGVSAPSLWD